MRHQEFRDHRLDAMQWYDEPVTSYVIPDPMVPKPEYRGTVYPVLAQHGHWLVLFMDEQFSVTHAPSGIGLGPRLWDFRVATRLARQLDSVDPQFYSLQDPAFKMTLEELRDLARMAAFEDRP